MPTQCLHCEDVPPLAQDVLCYTCRNQAGIAYLYCSAMAESPLWTAHLMRLRRRAEAGLPLFAEDPPRNVNRGRRERKTA